MPRSGHRVAASVLAAISATLAVTGCQDSDRAATSGGAGGSEESVSAPDPATAPRALGDYLSAIDAGDAAAACAFETDSYAETANEYFGRQLSDGDLSCGERVVQTSQLLDAFEVSFSDAELDARAGSTDTEAIVEATYPNEEGSDTYTLLWVEDRWLVNGGGDVSD